MTVLEIFCRSARCFSAGAAGLLFLRAQRRGLLAGAAIAALLGTALPVVFPRVPATAACFAACGAAAGFLVLSERRAAGDGALAFCAGLSAEGLFAVFEEVPDLLCSEELLRGGCRAAFALMLLMALKVSPLLSLPKDWRLAFEGGDAASTDVYRVASGHIYAAGAAMAFLMTAGFAAVPAAGAVSRLARLLLALTLFLAFWAAMPLLVAYSRKEAMFSAEYSYRNEMNAFMNVVRSQRHDYNLHVQTVASLIRQQKWEECSQYVNALTEDTAAMNAILPLRDPAIAALIEKYKTVAAQRGIQLEIDIRDDLSRVVTSVYETNKIIGNLLQNAIDETEKLDRRPASIQLGIFKRGEFCMIRVSNPIAEPEAFRREQENMFSHGYTTKSGHDGVGLSSIRTLASRVGGEVSAWLEGGTVHFIATIPMIYDVAD